jgi:hypothetical protein
MTSQFFVINMTGHNMCLKSRKHNKWFINAFSAHSWGLPIDANCPTKYKIKHDGKTIACALINHNGLLVGVKNLTKKFLVSSDNNRSSQLRFITTHDNHRNSDASARYPHPQEPVSITIRNSCEC